MGAPKGATVYHWNTNRTGTVVDCPGWIPVHATCVDFGSGIEEIPDSELEVVSAPGKESGTTDGE
jgi:hypothetical protein